MCHFFGFLEKFYVILFLPPDILRLAIMRSVIAGTLNRERRFFDMKTPPDS